MLIDIAKLSSIVFMNNACFLDPPSSISNNMLFPNLYIKKYVIVILICISLSQIEHLIITLRSICNSFLGNGLSADAHLSI